MAAPFQADGNDENVAESFDWLSRENRGPAYISHAEYSHLTASSFDFGSDGYAASCSYGGALLHMCAPSPLHGLIFIRGDFRHSLYAAIARAQRDTLGKSTFGFEILGNQKPYHPRKLHEASDKGSSFKLGKRLERGCLNYRWPLNEYSLILNEDSSKDWERRLWDSCNWRVYNEDRKHLLANGKEPAEINKIMLEHEDTRLDRVDAVFEEEMKKQKVPHKRQQSKDVDSGRTTSTVGSSKHFRTISDSSETISKQRTRSSVLTEQEAPPVIAGVRSDLDKVIGTCVTCSFVRNKTLFQIIRLEEGPDTNHCFPEPSQISLKIGGHVNLSIFGTEGERSITDGAGQEIRSADDSQARGDGSASRPQYPSLVYSFFLNTVRLATLEARVYQFVPANAVDSLKDDPLLEMLKDDGGGAKGHTRSKAHYRRLPLERIDRRLESPDGHSKLYTYRALGRLMTETGLHGKKHATFIAAIRLHERMPDPPNTNWNTPSSSSIYKYMCAFNMRPHAGQATGFLWKHLFLQRYLLCDSISRLSEVHLIARCLEKVLQVDSIPVKGSIDDGRRRSCIILSNTFTQPAIDHKSSFWKLRFLIKIYLFLQHVELNYRDEAKNMPKGDEQNTTVSKLLNLNYNEVSIVHEIIQDQLKRIKAVVDGVLTCLLEALQQASSPRSEFLNQITAAGDDHNRYYLYISLWYIVKNLPSSERDKSHVRDMLGLESADTQSNDLEPTSTESITLSTWYGSTNVPMEENNALLSAADKSALALLQWYHYGSLLELCRKNVLPEAWYKDGLLGKKVHQLRNSALIASASKLSSKIPYSARDEAFDRLSFLGVELGLEDRSDTMCTVASLSMRRIKERDFTRYINPGRSASDSDTLLDGPWEVHALCHHSRLAVLNLESYDSKNWKSLREKAEEIELYKWKLTQFMNSEATLVPCWERSHMGTRQGWVRSETTSVLASTLLDIHQKISNDPARLESNTKRLERDKDFHEIMQELRRARSISEQHTLLLERLKPDALVAPPVEWSETWRMPKRYHPDNFFHSLDDTPELFGPSHVKAITAKLPVPLLAFVDISSDIEQNGFRKENLEALEDQDFMHLVDIVDHKRHVVSATDAFQVIDKLNDSLVDNDVRHRMLAVSTSEPKKDLVTMLAYVLCPRSSICLSNHMLKISRFTFTRRNEWIARITLTSWYVAVRPCPSCGVQRPCPCGTESMDGPYEPNIDSIYLPCHFDELVKKDLREPDEDHIKDIVWINESGRDCWNPDATINEIEKGVISDRTLLLLGSFKPQASSFILATNYFGDFSKSSAISKLIDAARLKELGKECRAVWQQFVHQPQTARCLVFYVVLGDLCAQISEQYQVANRAIKSTLRLDKVFNQKDKQWAKDEEAVENFKLGLWTLESFYRLRHSLKESIDSVAEARGTLNAQIKEGPGARSEPLEEECQQYLEVFENKFAGLTAVAVELEEFIELNVRYKEAFEAVLTLDDSRVSLKQSDTSLKQNVTIQKLTYLTIGYLPLGLMAAIFAIPHEQKVVAQPMGLKWFIVGIVLLMLVTYVIAWNLSLVMRVFEGISQWLQQWLRPIVPRPYPYLQRRVRNWQEKRKKKKDEEDGVKA